MRRDGFDIITELEKTLGVLGLDQNDSVSELVITGTDPLLDSPIRLGAAIGIPLLAAAVGVAQVHRARTGTRQRVELDLGQAVHRLTPYLGAESTINGYHANMGSLLGLDGLAPAIWDFYRTADDRWVIPIACYPRTRDALLEVLGCAHTREHIGAAIANWTGTDLEEAAAQRGIPLAMARTRPEFSDHPQGQAVLAEPVVAIEKIGDCPPRPLRKGVRPLAGLRCLAYTHIFAGTAAARTLAEHGADVLHVCEPDDFEHDLCWQETAIGLRSARLSLRAGPARERFGELLRSADVFVHNHRPTKLAKLGLNPQDCAAAAPGVIYCSIRCYGHTGPWRERGGFDHQAQAVVGFSLREGDGRPKLPPGRMLNDYPAAYFAAAGVLAALLRRAEEGGSYLVKVSLAGVANWAWDLGEVDPAQRAGLPEGGRIPEPEWLVRQTPLGELRHAAPPVRFSHTPSGWVDPVLVPRGSSQPAWR